MNEDEALSLGRDLKDAGIDAHGVLEVHEDGMLEGEYSLRLHTGSFTLTPPLMGILSDRNLSLSCLGERSETRKYLWDIQTNE